MSAPIGGTTDATTDPAVVDVEGLGVPGRLDGVTLRLEGGAYALIGANGAGKSSLLHVLAGRLRPRSGRVRLLGRRPRDPRVARLRAYVPQGIELPLHLRVEEVLAAAARARGATPGALRTAAGRMDLEPYAAATIRRLSGGLRQRVALAAGLMGEPRLWLLDEPASALDAGGLARLARWAEDHVTRGGTVVTSAHRPEEVDAFAHEAVLIQGGRVHGRHPVTELFELDAVAGDAAVAVPAHWRVRRRPSALLRTVLEGDDAA